MMMAQCLKDLAVELDVCVFTSTQVNASIKDGTHIRDEGTLQGGRATINKADNGVIMARVQNEDLEILKEGGVLDKAGMIPNSVTDVFKVRNGSYTNVRIWSILDLGTLKRRDLFVTDNMYNPIDINVIGNFERELRDIEKEQLAILQRGYNLGKV